MIGEFSVDVYMGPVLSGTLEESLLETDLELEDEVLETRKLELVKLTGEPVVDVEGGEVTKLWLLDKPVPIGDGV